MYTNISSGLSALMDDSDGLTYLAQIRESGTAKSCVIRSMKVSLGGNGTNYITMGTAYCASAELTLYGVNFEMRAHEYEVCLGMDVNGTPEYIPMGLFTAEKPVLDGENIKVTLYDRMKKFEKAYFSSLSFPNYGSAIIAEICTQCGVPYEELESNVIIDTKPEGYTCREMVSYIAQLFGCFAVINRSGKLEFKWYSGTVSRNLSAGQYWDPFDRSENNYTLHRIAAVIGKETNQEGQSVDKVVACGTGAKGIVFANPFFTQEIMNEIWSSRGGYAYRPGTVKALGDPRLDPGDLIAVEAMDGNTYMVPVMTIDYEYDGGLSMKISAVGEEEQRDDFSVKGPNTQAVERLAMQLLLAERILANKVDVDVLTANYATIGSLAATNASIESLEADFGDFETLTANNFTAVNGNIDTLNAAVFTSGHSRIGILEADYASIKSLLAGNAAATAADVIQLNAQNATIDTAFLRNLISANITVNDLLAGTIYTNLQRIMSQDGTFDINGSTMKITDGNDVVRVQIGKDALNDYNLYLWNEDGDLIWNAAGITADGIPNSVIVDDMVAAASGNYNGISASKLNIQSVVGGINTVGGLRTSSVVLDDTNQSLTVAFNALKSDVDNIEIGGRNLIVGTLNPDVSTGANRPHLKGQTGNTAISTGTATVAEHGFRVTNTGAYRTYIRFGTSTFSSATLNGLKAGETYTLSFDATYKLYGADAYPGTERKFTAYLYDNTNGATSFKANSDYTKIIETFKEADKTNGKTGRCEYTFTLAEDVTKFYIYLAADNTSTSNFAAGDFVELRNLKLEKGNKATDWTPAPEDYIAEMTGLSDLIDDLQDQLDGVIDTYYYDYTPTLNNVPASGWASTDYPSHRGDMFLDTSTGKSYRFLQDETTQTWSWVEIPDTASAAALVAAQEARDLADHKRRVFTDTPYPPYDEGDLWFAGASGDILTCTTAKTANGSYSSGDWSKLNKYTDDTAAVNYYTTLNTSLGLIEGRVGSVETTVSGHTSTINSHSSTLTQTQDKIAAIISDSQISQLPSGTTMFSKLASVETTANGTVTRLSQLDVGDGTLESFVANYNQTISEFSVSISNAATKSETVTGVVVEYALGDSQTTAPASGWSTNSPVWTSGKYIWQRTAITKNGTTTYSNVTCIQGASGGDFVFNLISGTMNPSVAAARYYPHFAGQSGDSAVSAGTVTTAEHGIRVTNTGATRTYIRIGYNIASESSLYGLAAGKKYTLSFDAAWKQLGGGGANTTTYYLNLGMYYVGEGSTGWTTTSISNFATITAANRGTDMTGRYEIPFTVPATATAIYLMIRCSMSTASYYAAGDYIELANIKLEEGDRATVWAPAYDELGTRTATVCMYKRAASTPTGPTGPLTYNFNTGGMSGTASYFSGWSTQIPSGTNPCYVIMASASANTDTDIIEANEWTAPVLFVENGEDGTSGVNGYNQATIYLYKRAASAPTTPTTTSAYTFSTGALSNTPSGWSTGIPAVNGNPCYVCTGVAISRTDTASIAAWSSPVKLVEDGQDGIGINSVTVTYGKSSSASTQPTSWGSTIPTISAGEYLWTRTVTDYTDPEMQDTVTLTYSRQGADGQAGTPGQAGTSVSVVSIKYQEGASATTAPTGTWSDSPVAAAQGKYLWTKTTFSDNSVAYGVARQGANGTNGTNGLNQATLYLYQRAASAPSKPSATVTYTFSTKTATGMNNGWTTTIPSGTNPCWVTIATASSNTATDTIAASEWTDPVKLVENGTNGTNGTNGINGTNGVDGYNQATVYLYQRAASAPSKPSSALTYTFSTGKLTSVPSGWSQAIPAANGNPCYVTTAAAIGKNATVSIAASAWSGVVKLVEDGQDGNDGDDGVSITGVRAQYYLSTSDTSPTGGVWSYDPPEWVSGKYLWTRSEVTYSSGSPTYTDPVLDQINTDLEERVTTAELQITSDAIVSTVKQYGASNWNLLDIKDDLVTSSATKTLTGYAVTVESSASAGGIYIKSTVFKPNTTYTLSYKFRKTAGTLTNMGWTASSSQFDIISRKIDGTETSSNPYDMSNDTAEHTAIVVFTTKSTVNNFYIQANKSDTTAVTVKYWDMQVEIGTTVTPWSPSTINSESYIQQTAEEIRLKATILTWDATNSKLTADGKLYVKQSAEIGGIHIGVSNFNTQNELGKIYSDGKTTYNAGASGFYMDSSGKFGVGSSTKHIQWDGSDLEIKVTNLTWTATNSSMTANGTLTASNADISGKISATSGLIGGWHVGSTSLWNSTVDGTTAEGDYQVSMQVNSSATALITDDTITMYTRKYIDGGWRYGYSLTYGGQITLNTFDSNGKNTDRILLGHGSFEIRHATAYSTSDQHTMSKYDSVYVNNGMLRFNRAGNNVAYMGPWTWDLQNSSGSKEGLVFLGQLAYLGIGHGNQSDIVINNGLNDGFTERIIFRDTTRFQGNMFLSSGCQLRFGSSSSAYIAAKSDGAFGLGMLGTSSYARYLVCDSSDNMRLYSSSSKRYKNLIGEASDEDAKKLLSLPVVNFVYKPGYLVEDDENNGRVMAGLFAEDVAKLFPDAVYHHDDQIENYADRQLLVRLIKLVQIQQHEIDELKKGVA